MYVNCSRTSEGRKWLPFSWTSKMSIRRILFRFCFLWYRGIVSRCMSIFKPHYYTGLVALWLSFGCGAHSLLPWPCNCWANCCLEAPSSGHIPHEIHLQCVSDLPMCSHDSRCRVTGLPIRSLYHSWHWRLYKWPRPTSFIPSIALLHAQSIGLYGHSIVLEKHWRQLSFLHDVYSAGTFLLYWLNANVIRDGDILSIN